MINKSVTLFSRNNIVGFVCKSCLRTCSISLRKRARIEKLQGGENRSMISSKFGRMIDYDVVALFVVCIQYEGGR